MASKKKEELLQPEMQTQAQPAAQSTYSAEGLNSRADVEKAMANVSYRPGQQVTDAADALKQWQQNRPADYQSSYQDKINSLLGQLLALYWVNVELLGGLMYPVRLLGMEFELFQQGMALLALIPVWLYRGRQGHHSKPFQYACYAFYPVHMLVLAIVLRCVNR